MTVLSSGGEAMLCGPTVGGGRWHSFDWSCWADGQGRVSRTHSTGSSHAAFCPWAWRGGDGVTGAEPGAGAGGVGPGSSRAGESRRTRLRHNPQSADHVTHSLPLRWERLPPREGRLEMAWPLRKTDGVCVTGRTTASSSSHRGHSDVLLLRITRGRGSSGRAVLSAGVDPSAPTRYFTGDKTEVFFFFFNDIFLLREALILILKRPATHSACLEHGPELWEGGLASSSHVRGVERPGNGAEAASPWRGLRP